MIKPLIPSGFFMPQIELYFTTPITPKKNSFRAGITKNGRLYQFKGKNARVSESNLQQEAFLQAKKLGIKPTDKPVSVSFLFKKTRADLIGITETLQDALQGVIYLDDKQIWQQHMEWDVKRILPEGYTCFLKIEVE